MEDGHDYQTLATRGKTTSRHAWPAIVCGHLSPAAPPLACAPASTRQVRGRHGRRRQARAAVRVTWHGPDSIASTDIDRVIQRVITRSLSKLACSRPRVTRASTPITSTLSDDADGNLARKVTGAGELVQLQRGGRAQSPTCSTLGVLSAAG
jgi:hypothetical protein